LFFFYLSFVVVLAVPTPGQIPKLKAQAPAAAQLEPPQDPLGRTTPRGTVTAFVRALHRDDYVSAARYMQLSPKQKNNAEVLARNLKDLMDRYFQEPLAAISDLPSGSLDDGLPLDQERAGPLTMQDKAADIMLVRVTDPDAGQIWLISSDTLAQVPAWHDAIQQTWLERVMPDSLQTTRLFGVSLAQGMAWGSTFALPLLLFWLIARLSVVLIEKLIPVPSRRQRLEVWNDGLRWPTIILLTLIVHLLSISTFVPSLIIRVAYTRLGFVLVVISAAWLLRRICALSFEQARIMLRRRGQAGTESLILLGERVLNVIIALIAVFAILTIVGVDTKTALAGVGIGGVAIAFGAQKTVENLLGGVFLLTDQALAIGDTCCISNRMGTVEDITLRSVRLRTTEQTLLSIPAGVLSQANIENFATRQKMLVQTRLPLRYGTTAAQVRAVINGLRQLLNNTPSIETGSSYVRLMDFGPRAIELELFAYVLTSNGMKFLGERESLLLQATEIVESAGTGFASPTQLILREPTASLLGEDDNAHKRSEGAADAHGTSKLAS
jgi:MscS family membrane protein